MIDIVALTAGEPEVEVADGTHLLRAGERADVLYVLLSGALRVERDGRLVAELDEPGAIVGELGLLLDMAATADVLAVGDTVVRRLDDAERCFTEHPGFGRHLATVLARRLTQVSSYLADLERQFADRSDSLGVVPEVLAELLRGQGETIDPGSDREPDAPY
jgi:CRP/FNR family cyclic AMP-dependent transcriptional regulator